MKTQNLMFSAFALDMYSKHHKEINVSVVKIVYVADSFSYNFHWSGLSFSSFKVFSLLCFQQKRSWKKVAKVKARCLDVYNNVQLEKGKTVLRNKLCSIFVFIMSPAVRPVGGDLPGGCSAYFLLTTLFPAAQAFLE